MEDTPRTDEGQGNSEKPPTNLFELAMQCGGGFLPPRGSGAAIAVVWQRLFDKDEATIRRWVRDLKIPHRKLGSTLLIDTDAFWDYLPLVSQLEDESKE